MHIRSLTLTAFAALTLAGCGKPELPPCVASELGNGIVSLHTQNQRFSCRGQDAAVTMADYIGKRPELDVEVIAFNKFGAVTTLRTTPKAKAPATQ